MNVADLYVNLGLKGKNDVSKGLGEVGSDLSSVQSMSLEAKAAILGVVYGFEQMVSKAIQSGTNLSNFTDITGTSAKELQQFRWVMEGTGNSADELQGFLGSLQKQMTNIDFSKGMPEGMRALEKFTGSISKADRDNPFEMLKRLQAFSQNKTLTDAQKNHILDTFGMPDGVKAATRMNAFQDVMLKKAPVLSEAVLKANRAAGGTWAHTWTVANNAMMKFNAGHGAALAKNIETIVGAMAKLAESLIKIADRLKIFEWVTKAFEGWKMIIDALDEGAQNAIPTVGDDVKGMAKQPWYTTVGKALFNSDAEKRAREGLKRLGDADQLRYSLKAPMQNPAAVHTTTQNFTTYASGVEGAAQLADVVLERNNKQFVNNSPQARVKK